MNLKAVSTSGIEPVTLAEAKAQLNIDAADTAWDALINSLIPVAREVAENETARDLRLNTYELLLPVFYPVMIMPRNPLVEIVSIHYKDDAGVYQIVPAADYSIQAGDKGLLYIKTEAEPNGDRDAVKITFKAGYATAAEVPRKTWQGMQFTLSHFFENRSSVIEGRSTSEVPFTAKWLFQKDRLY